MGLGDAMWKFDANVIDGAVNGAGWSTRMSGTLSVLWDKWVIDGLFVNGVAIVTKAKFVPRAVGAVGTGAVVCIGDGGRSAEPKFLLLRAGTCVAMAAASLDFGGAWNSSLDRFALIAGISYATATIGTKARGNEGLIADG